MSKVAEIHIPTQCEVNPPTAEYPICIQKELKMNRGKQYRITVSFYNNEAKDISPDVIPIVTCSNSLESNEIDLLSTSTGAIVKVGETADYDLIMKVQKSTLNGMYPCILTISETQKPFTIKVG